MRIRTPLLLLVFAAVSVSAQWRSAPDVDAVSTTGESEVTFRAGPSLLTVTLLADDLVRVRFRPSLPPLPDRSWAVIKGEWPHVKAEMTDSPLSFSISTTSMTLVVNKKPLRLSFRDATGAVINEDHPGKGMSWNGTEVRVWKVMPRDEHYYGFGEKAGTLERRDLHMTMWNSDIPGYTAATDPLYESIPFFYGMRNGKAYAIFLDNSCRTSFDMGKESGGQYSFGAEAGDLNYYFFCGPSPAKILSRFAELVGHMPVPPLWSLGYQQCRWSYPTEHRVREIAAGFRSRKIPCDVLYLDIDYMDGYRIFTWNKASFPDPAKMIRELGTDGFKIAVIVDPGIKVDTGYSAYRSGLAGDHFLRSPDGTVYTGKVWPGICAFPDFTGPGGRRWWGDQFEGLAAAGVRGWWNDMNEPSVFDVPTKTIDLDVIHDDEGLKTGHGKNHNIYGMQMTRATYEGVRRHLPNERPFVLTRASYAGGWRYASAWTGDNVSTWDHLSMALPMCLNLSISGQPFVGSDIGGFMGHPSGELFARWLQLGVFTPLMRAHSVINEKNKEPWEYGGEFTDINRETINLRYRLLPYIYTTMAEASVSGMPAMRPMVFVYPEDPRYTFTDDQFMFGPDLLVSPELREGERERSVELPRGTWYDFWSGTKFGGGKRIVAAAPLSRIPFFVRAGAVIPTRQIVQSTSEAPIDPLTLLVYPPDSGATGISSYYEDDGISFDYEKGNVARRTMTVLSDRNGLTLKVSPVEGKYAFPPRRLVVRFVGVMREPAEVVLAGRRLVQANGGLSATRSTGWMYDGNEKSVTVSMPESRGAIQIALRK